MKVKLIGISNIKVNKVNFQITVHKDRKQIYYGLMRNKKALISSSYPKDRKSEVMMNIYRDFQEAIGYEIRNEIEKLKL